MWHRAVLPTTLPLAPRRDLPDGGAARPHYPIYSPPQGGWKHKAVESRIAASEGERCQARSFLQRSASSTWRIGRATALAFARQGAKDVVGDVSDEGAETVELIVRSSDRSCRPPSPSVAPESLYWAGVSRYKNSGDRRLCGERRRLSRLATPTTHGRRRHPSGRTDGRRDGAGRRPTDGLPAAMADGRETAS